MLADISDYNNMSDVLPLLFGIIAADVTTIFGVRYLPSLFSKELNQWYDKFELTAVMADVLIILLGFFLARYIYTTWIKPIYGWHPFYFLGLLVLLQVVHDILFYLAIILPIPIGHNAIIDLFKQYSLRDGPKIIGGDSILMILSALIAMYYKTLQLPTLVTYGTIGIYSLTYILYTKSPFNTKEKE
jgi:hypothetical protein